jgi:hypothetical protein
MSKKKLTKADLDSTLRELGFKEGDRIELPSSKTSHESTSTTGEGDEGDGEEGNGNGGNHPTKKPGG